LRILKANSFNHLYPLACELKFHLIRVDLPSFAPLHEINRSAPIFGIELDRYMPYLIRLY
jgi:hypothetical protein